MAVVYGDLLMRVLYRVRPYERIGGSANLLYDTWVPRCKESIRTGSQRTFKENIYRIVEEFDNLDVYNVRKPRVGLVGEILVKFHPQANNNVVDIIERGSRSGNAGLNRLLLYCAYNENFKYAHLSGKKLTAQ